MARSTSKLLTKSLLICMLLLLFFSMFDFTIRADPTVSPKFTIPIGVSPDQVSLVYYRRNGFSHMNVTIEFPNTAYYVDNWGSIDTSGNDISASAQAWFIEDVFHIPVFIYLSNTYDLGALSPGTYNFIFKVWGEEVKRTNFTIQTQLIVPDDYATIQEAINGATDGNTVFVKSGIYYEHIAVNKTVTLLGENLQNTIIDGSGTGTVVSITANNIKISGFTIQNGARPPPPENNAAACIEITVSSNNTIAEGNILRNSAVGVEVEGHNSSITNNLIEDNWKGIGIYFGFGGNTFVNNTVTNSTLYGIEVIYSLNNTIFHNSFVGNNQSAYSTGATNNWDNGIEGNYWSGYNGIDSNHNGIGDTPYVIDANNQDNYPLMKPFLKGDLNHDGIVDIGDASLIGMWWQKTIPPAPANLDLNGDGIINISEAAIIGTNWQKHIQS